VELWSVALVILNIVTAMKCGVVVSCTSYPKYCDIFAESCGMLLGNNTINGDVTMEHVTL
jgi:hypothetical protein